MKEELKTKKQLSAELLALRRRLTDLEMSASPGGRLQEEHYRQLFEGNADGYAAVDTEGVITECNSAFRKMVGYTEAELNGMTYRDLSPEQWHGMEEKIIKEQIRTGSFSTVYEKEYRRKDGSVFPVELLTYLLRDKNGAHTGLWAVIRDITDRKQAEKVLKASEERFFKAFQSSPAPTFISTISEGRYIDVNDSGLRLLCYDREEMIGHTVRELAIWGNLADRKSFVERLLKEGSIRNESLSLRTKTGVIIETLWSCEIIRLNDEEVMLSLLYDITERKRAEASLHESERRLADIIDFLPDATFAIDLRGKVIAWNRAIEEMTGVAAEDILGRGDFAYAVPFYGEERPMVADIILKPNKRIEQSYDSLVKKEHDTLFLETWVQSLKGEEAFLWGKASPLYDSKGNVVGAIESIRDITERKRAEEALKKREEDLAIKTRELEDLNVTLRVLLKQREGDQRELEEKILSNVKLLIEPFVEKLKNHTDPEGSSYVKVIESNLQDIVSPFSRRLSTKYLSLTNKEMQVASLIKEEKTTKEIADILNVSESAVNVHRYHIRKKVGLTKSQNLLLYLSSLASN
jgi:PAS domain S-box-containing protein